VIYHYVSEMQAYIALPGISNTHKDQMKSFIQWRQTGNRIKHWLVLWHHAFLLGLGEKNSLWGVMSKLRHVLGNCSTLTQRVDSEQSVAQTQLVFRCFNSTKEWPNAFQTMYTKGVLWH